MPRTLDLRAVFFSCLCAVSGFATVPSVAPRQDIDLSGAGWHLWLDRDASWKDDRLYFPTPPLDQLPVNPPTGGWAKLEGTDAVAVSVPGTVEQYLQKEAGPGGDIRGVSWWRRTLELPAITEGAPRSVLLRFESVRLRAEVFVNRRLAGYDVVGNSPFELDITRFIRAGGPCEIAVRITDPAGNFDWRDSQPMYWAGQALPMSHGFGGITGRVRLVICDPVQIDDVYVQNTPQITEANVQVTVRNSTAAAVVRDVKVTVAAKSAPDQIVATAAKSSVTLPPGESRVDLKVSAPAASIWDLEHPNLYVSSASLMNGTQVLDHAEQTFGFRWFAPDGIGRDAVLRLNGKRIVLRTAISWGFWPINGIFPTDALAEKQVRVAKELGLNMLNFHRAIGNPVVLEKADELGLLYFEEPGAHKSVDHVPFGQRLAREKLLRMVKRDRSHPSLVIYNLINEWDSRNPRPNPAEIERHRADMAAAHELDPSRLIVHTSAWARGEEIEDPAKLHYRPFDAKPYLSGWYDVHHAGGPATWNESLYRSPTEYYGRTDNRHEIVFWGEEGAISTPPRLALIKTELEHAPQLGWDGAMYLDWYRQFESFLDRKGLRAGFPTVDIFTSSMGAVSLQHQGRRIENMRMSDVGDGYAVNGWEAEIIENHSGIVDCFRNPKADARILAYYNQPLYVAVKVRTSVVAPGADVIADLFIVNERNLHGRHQLVITLRDANGSEISRAERGVEITGGDRFGELLAAGIRLPVGASALGSLLVEATLRDADGATVADGRDTAVVVDWRSAEVHGHGAVWESEDRVHAFLAAQKQVEAPTFTRNAPVLDWIAVARGPSEAEAAPLPLSLLHPGAEATSASPHGVRVSFFRDPDFQEQVHQRVDSGIRVAVDDGAAPDPALGVMTNYGIRWETVVTAEHTGTYGFVLRSSGAVKLWIDGKLVIEEAASRVVQTARASAILTRGKPAVFRVEMRQGRGAAVCDLAWVVPEDDETLGRAILDRVRRDGTTLVLLERAEAWMPLIAADAKIAYHGSFKVGKTWLGGIHFVREHPLFAGLPVNVAMDWPYQAVVRNGDERLGLLLEGEDLVAGCYHSFPMQLGTVVGVIPFGKGKIVFSTLDLCSNLAATDGPATVARRLLVNCLNYK